MLNKGLQKASERHNAAQCLSQLSEHPRAVTPLYQKVKGRVLEVRPLSQEASAIKTKSDATSYTLSEMKKDFRKGSIKEPLSPMSKQMHRALQSGLKLPKNVKRVYSSHSLKLRIDEINQANLVLKESKKHSKVETSAPREARSSATLKCNLFK